MNDGLTAWVTNTAPRALAYATSLVQNETVAEDLVQDCYQRLLAKADKYDLANDGAKLLFKAITNACINWSQRKPPVVSLESLYAEAGADAVAGAGGPVQDAICGELAAAVERALAELPVNQRAAVELHALGHSATDMADMLQITPGNARVLLHRGRQQLAERLKPFVEERET